MNFEGRFFRFSQQEAAEDQKVNDEMISLSAAVFRAFRWTGNPMGWDRGGEKEKTLPKKKVVDGFGSCLPFTDSFFWGIIFFFWCDPRPNQ